MQSDALRFSVIVPVHDDNESLAGCLTALRRQTVPPEAYEVIVVDDGSAVPAACALAAPDANVQFVRVDHRNSFAARNSGVGLATGAYLAFCDADCRPEPDWLASLSAIVRPDRLVAGAVAMTVPDPATWWTLLDLGAYLDQERLVLANRAVTANLVVARSVFEAVGGFEATQASGGDFAFTERCCRLGYELTYARTCVVCHPTRDSARSHLGKLWRDDRSYAARRTDGLWKMAARWTGAGELCWRAVTRRPIVVDAERAALLGLQPRRGDMVGVALLRYGVLPVWRMAAHSIGFATQRS